MSPLNTTTTTLSLMAVVLASIGAASALNSVLDIKGTYPYLINNVTGQMIEPCDYMDFENIYAPNSTYRRTQTAQGRNYHLIKAFDFANYFQSDYWHYSEERDLLMSGFPVANESACSQQLDWIESQVNLTNNLFARGEQHLNLMLLMDSFGRPQASTYLGRAHWLGSYYECKRVQLTTELEQRPLKTHYCVGKARDIDWPSRAEDPYTPQISYKVGLCLPETCDTLSFRSHQSQIQRLMRFNMPQHMKDRIKLEEMYCLPNERSPVRELKLPARIYLSLCVLWLMTLGAATWLYSCYRCHRDDSRLMSKEIRLALDSAASEHAADSPDISKEDPFKFQLPPVAEAHNQLTALLLSSNNNNKPADSLLEQQGAQVNGNGCLMMAADEKFMLPPPHPLLVAATGVKQEVDIPASDQQSINSSQSSSISMWLNHSHPLVGDALRALSIIENIIDFQRPPAAIGGSSTGCKLVRVNLNALDAIKCLCCVLVIFGHIIFIHMQHISNVIQTIEQSSSPWPKLLIAFFNFVDTFFVISGMLTTYFLFKRFNRNTLGRPVVWLMIILLRLLRLSPVYLLVLWFTKTLAVHLGEGPLWDYGTDRNSIHGLCINDHWWKSILYLGNWGTMQPLCVLPAWSIIVDAQYSLILPPVIFLLMRHRKLGYLTLMVAVVVSTTNMSLQLASQTAVKASDMAKVRLHVYPLISRFAAEFYNTAWNRVGPVAVGVIGGHMLYLYDVGVVARWPWFMRGAAFKFVLFMHAFVFILPTLSQQGPEQQQQQQIEPQVSPAGQPDLTVFLLSNAAIKPIWSLINTVLLLRLITDLRLSSFVARLMSHNIWHCLGKICFASYLIHYEVIILLLKSKDEGLIEPSWMNALREFSLTFLISTILAYFIHVLFEAPINKLVTLPFSRNAKLAGRKAVPGADTIPVSRSSNSFQLNQFEEKLAADTCPESPVLVKRFPDKLHDCHNPQSTGSPETEQQTA